MQDDLEEKAAGLTHFIFQVPTYKRLILMTLLVSFFAGFGIELAFSLGESRGFTEAFFYGGPNGVMVFALPAVIAALLATSILSLSSFRQVFKYFLFIAFISMALTIAVSIAGLAVGKYFPRFGAMTEFLLLDAAFVMVIWLVSLRVPLNYSWIKSLAVSLLHPLLQISMLLIWKAYLVIEVRSPLAFGLQFVAACAILLLALWSLLMLVNAPAKRNFGISAVQASALFFAQWVKGGKGLEEILAEVGTLVETEVGTVGFWNRRGLKASFVVPLVHFGPVGNLGGSDFPNLISRYVWKKTGAPCLVFHGTVTHDFNPVFSSSFQHISERAIELLGNGKGSSPKASLWESDSGGCRLFLFGLGDDRRAFLSVSRAPSNTDDIELPLGYSIRNLLLLKGFSNSLIVDMHNSKTGESDVTTGSHSYYALEDAVRSLRRVSQGSLRLGIGTNPLSDFTARQGIGGAGLKVAVLKVGKKKCCIILVDANNVLPPFRSHLLESLRGYGFDFVDVYTTDSHSVNTISGVHNPLGANLPVHAIIPRVKAAVEKALRDLEPVSAQSATGRIKIHVLGENRTPELVSTINAVVAILRIIAPAVLLASVLLAFLALVLLGRMII
jgi:putative membrane protein